MRRDWSEEKSSSRERRWHQSTFRQKASRGLGKAQVMRSKPTTACGSSVQSLIAVNGPATRTRRLSGTVANAG
jgi:hypothetical protein